MTVQEKRIAALRKCWQTKFISQDQLNHITTDEHEQLGIIAEFVINGFLKPVHIEDVLRWQWTPAAAFALQIFEPRKGKHE